VRGLERLGDLSRDAERFVQRQCSSQQALREILAVDELHDERASIDRLLEPVVRGRYD